MTRHSKNCTANTVYTYHERRKDAKNSGYGTQTVRLGKDSIRPFDCCCLTLQPAKDPVITQDGFIYDRAAILEYIISQKADIRRREKIYAKQLDRAQRQAIEKKKAERNEKARAFMALNTLDTHSKASAQAAESAALASISKGNGRLTSLESDYNPGTAASFWTNVPSAAESNNDMPDIPKPDTTIRCPMSGKPIRYKDLVTVKFTNFVPDDKGASSNRSTTFNEIRRICAVSSDPLTSATHCFVLRPSGAVVTREVVEKIIKKDMVDPISGSKLTDADLIQVQTGCGGFADGRSVLTATRVAPAKAKSLIDVAREESPQFTFESNQLEILETPNDFFNTIENGLKTAKSRVVLSTLYLGTGEREEHLVKALIENSNKPLVIILADATRSTRPLKFTDKFVGQGLKASPSSPVVENSSPLFLLQRIANLPNSRVSLYQTHKLRGFLYKMLPKRINEIFGLQHMKVYIFDDDVIISGANLSDEYFTTRQDRAWVFRGVSKLAEFYTDLINIVSSLSYVVTPEGELKANSKETDLILANKSAYCSLFQARIEYFLSTAKVKYSSSLDADSTSFSSVILPLVQMGAYKIRQEVPFVMRILQYLRMCDDNESSLEISLTSGYFCPTDEFEEALVAVSQRSIQPPKMNVLCAAPEANSFFKSRGISGGIPAAYREMLISFLRRIAQHPSSPNNIQVNEYFRPGWTFHAKGLWINTSSTTLNFVGSSNYGYRSRDLDLETQIVVASNDPKAREKIEAERKRLWDPQYLRPVTVEGLSVSTEPRFKWYARWMLPALRRIM